MTIDNGACKVTLSETAGDTAKLSVPHDVHKATIAWEKASAPKPVDKVGTTLALKRPEAGLGVKGVLTLTLRSGAGTTEVTCPETAYFVSALEAPKKPVANDTNAVSPLSRYDVQAAEWWQTSGAERQLSLLTALENQNPNLGNVRLFVHLPSGAPAPGLDPKISEGRPAQVALIVPDSAAVSADLSVTGCADVDAFRMKKEPETGKEGAEQPSVAVQPSFKLITVGTILRCGPKEYTYAINTRVLDAAAKPNAPAAAETFASSKTNVRVSPKYHVAGAVLLGFDTATTHGFVRDTDRETDVVTIAEEQDRVGASAYFGAQWMVGGVDYTEMRWYNYFANAFLAVDLTSPLEDLATGLMITPTGGISLALGVTLHRGTKLDDYEVGDTFTGDGNIPTKDSWSEASVGFFAGFGIDNNVYTSLTEAFE